MRNIFLMLILVLTLTTFGSFAQESVFKNFITAKDGKLWDGSKEFRFISFNIPNLNYIEDEFGYVKKQPYRFPDSFEMTDAMESIKQLGGNVIRNYTFPVRNIHEEPYPTYILAPGKFDEEAFKTMDTLLAIANKVGVRVILPFVNCWQWMGGRPQYADFRNKTEDEFWTDFELIEDVKATINFVINRINTVTGTVYKDEKAILCWETGNELTAPFSWTQTMTRYIKSLDSNHLVFDGYNAINNVPILEDALNEPSIDIVSTHHYEEDPFEFITNILNHVKEISGRKAYIVGEFGFMGTPAIEEALNMIIGSNISGAMIWSLRSHRREGGFYWHSEPLGMGIYKAYHYPGFTSGLEYDETNMLNLMRQKAFAIQNLPVPSIEAPKAPLLLPIKDASQISWQGSVGAAFYDVERSANESGPWEIIGFNVTDADAQYFPLFCDNTVEIGEEYFYRVIAKNQAGNSQSSNIVGPVRVEHKCLIDEMINFGQIFNKTGNVELKTDNDRVFREKKSRLQGDVNSEIIYIIPGELQSGKVFAFTEKDDSTLEFFISEDNLIYSSLPAERASLYSGKGSYGYWVPGIYSFNLSVVSDGSKSPTSDGNDNREVGLLQAGVRYIKLVFKETTQLQRAEFYYTE
ncbi:MAG: cellulase family glycosylhydrolase [bacterium]